MNAEIENVSQCLRVPSRASIDILEQHLFALPQVDLHVEHYFADGLYARELHIPAGCTLTGKVHKREHINIVSQGTIVVWTEDGMKEVSAPFTMVSRPGTKRVGHALTDCVWTTVHALPNDVRDIPDVEDMLVERLALEHQQ